MPGYSVQSGRLAQTVCLASLLALAGWALVAAAAPAPRADLVQTYYQVLEQYLFLLDVCRGIVLECLWYQGCPRT